jgi:hypothetical protein
MICTSLFKSLRARSPRGFRIGSLYSLPRVDILCEDILHFLHGAVMSVSQASYMGIGQLAFFDVVIVFAFLNQQLGLVYEPDSKEQRSAKWAKTRFSRSRT